jgi:hypothetical protein
MELSWIGGFGEDQIYLMCLGVEYFALILNAMFGMLGWLWMRWLGVFIAPNHFHSRWGGCCRWTHQTVRCATGHSLLSVRAPPRHPTVRVLEQLTVGAFVFLWHWTVWWCTGQSGAPLTRCSDFCVSLCCIVPAVRVDCCVLDSRYSLAHRTVRWNIVERACVFPRVVGWPLYGPGASDTVRCARSQHTQVL